MFEDYFIRIKVRLNSDLTNYIPGLERGLEGYTIGNAYKSDTYDAVINVYFKKIDLTTSIVLDKLDIIDKEYLAFLKAKEAQCLDTLKNAKHIIKNVGPAGGFKSLSFSLSKEKLTIYNRKYASKIEEKFQEYNLEVPNKVIK